MGLGSYKLHPRWRSLRLAEEPTKRPSGDAFGARDLDDASMAPSSTASSHTPIERGQLEGSAEGITWRTSDMSSNVPAPRPDPDPQDLKAQAHRWVRRQRILYTILAIYAVLSLMWFAIDMADGTENLWFYWPMLGTGVIVAITSVVLVGVGGLFGADWEQRQIDRYVEQRRPPDQAP